MDTIILFILYGIGRIAYEGPHSHISIIYETTSILITQLCIWTVLTKVGAYVFFLSFFCGVLF